MNYSKYPHIGDEAKVYNYYTVVAEQVSFVNSITILDSENNKSIREYNGFFFVSVQIKISANNSDDIKEHKFDTNDFRLKNHIGTNISLNSGDRFYFINAFEDYSWCDKTISKGETLSFVTNFKFDSKVDLNDCVFVLEVDFSNKIGNHTDIVLSENAIEFQK